MKPGRVALALLALLLAGCAAVLGPRTYTLGEAELSERIARKFPLDERVLDLFDLHVAVPVVTLLPERNRVGVDLDLSFGERLTARRLPVHLSLDSGLRFDAAAGAVILSQVKVNRLSFDGVPAGLAPTLRRVAEPLAEQWLEGLPVHRFTAEQLQAASQAHYTADVIKVTPRGVEMTLRPVE